MVAMRLFFLAILPLACLVTLAGTPASAQNNRPCPERLGVSYGMSDKAIAKACGINVQQLQQANPGLGTFGARHGTRVTVPRPTLPSPQLRTGQPSVQIMPSRVPRQQPIGRP